VRDKLEETPLVSFVLPCYNSHQYLHQTLSSIRKQTYKNFEIILVNDGSSCAETKAFISTLDTDVQVIHQANKGLPSARNAGFSSASGKFIVPLDCDDWIDSTFVEKCLLKLSTDVDSSFVFCDIKLEGESSGILQKKYNYYEQLFFNQLPYCLFLPKKIWNALGGYNEKMRDGYEDWEFNIRLGQRGYYGAKISEPLFHYRVSQSGMLSKISRRKHVNLWFDIQNNHPEIYSFRNICAIGLEWRIVPTRYSKILLFAWWIVCLIVPKSFSNRLFSLLFPILSHSKNL